MLLIPTKQENFTVHAHQQREVGHLALIMFSLLCSVFGHASQVSMVLRAPALCGAEAKILCHRFSKQ